ncbi:2-amino-4-hydroxy-6-hydroxymethyldihydropteridine diphosphokinase [Anatilimnocola floriformis]|uniref:2-amino-4-hydroxy-6- hydroxymethyldihydropteridine diphosphokinase n=1 Tax=Anatilimnocola floriformis TaxID=2948575 RepID=UPI0020C45261|nr:2-amino-4-hydroxy-6-hydroxymethyldihydropteridine diphosphokinase [Anatilimnocola floriformis]
MANCLLSLGSNLGDRGAHLQAALRSLSSLPQTVLLAQSSFRDTKPVGGPAAQDPFLNAAALIETSLSAQQLLAELQRIENELGRVRTERWGPRTIDLDLLLYDKLELESPELTLPHPRMSFRRFVLEPANEIAAEMVYPINGWTIARLLENICKLPAEIALSPGLSESELRIDHSPEWALVDFDEQSRRELHGGVKPRLVVVWHPADAPSLSRLRRIRRRPDSPPMLWIAGASFEQARQEVIAAMAAME